MQLQAHIEASLAFWPWQQHDQARLNHNWSGAFYSSPCKHFLFSPNPNHDTNEKLFSVQGTPLFTSNQSIPDLTYSSSSLSTPSCTFLTRNQSSSSLSSLTLALANPGIIALHSLQTHMVLVAQLFCEHPLETTW